MEQRWQLGANGAPFGPRTVRPGTLPLCAARCSNPYLGYVSCMVPYSSAGTAPFRLHTYLCFSALHLCYACCRRGIRCMQGASTPTAQVSSSLLPPLLQRALSLLPAVERLLRYAEEDYFVQQSEGGNGAAVATARLMEQIRHPIFQDLIRQVRHPTPSGTVPADPEDTVCTK